ncbi:MAG: shikimate kinase [Candidatus Lokiarchaeota archaeon]|nr:shikimate kinase [Candidatus Lokiarchaeota archaeon]
MKKACIALIGFMATGKTTVGKALAKHLGDAFKFIETDQIIIEMVGKTIPDIFSEDGEVKFREYEVAACKKVSNLSNIIVSCGGGVVLNKVNIDNLKLNCHIVLLEASIEEIYKRAMRDGKETRPVINKDDPKKEIENVLVFRKPYYQAAAEYIIDTTSKEIQDIVEEIVIKTHLKT